MKKIKSFFTLGFCAIMICSVVGCLAVFGKKEKSHAEVVDVVTFEQLQEAILSDAESIVIGGDIAFSSTLEISKNVVISSNGNFTFERATGFSNCLISVKPGASLSIETKAETSITFDGKNVLGENSVIYNEGMLTLGENVTIKNFLVEFAKGVAVYNGGTFNLKGAEIINNTHDGITTIIGGGPLDEEGNPTDIKPGNGIVYCYKDSIFNFESGKVSNNTSVQSGTIYVHDGTQLKMSGGEVCNNVVYGKTADGANTDNRVGGGFYIKAANAEFTGGLISGNSAVDGGGVQCTDEAVAVFDGVEISNNTATGSKAKKNGGGGLCIKSNAKVTLKSVKISGNTSAYGGGIACFGHAELIIDGAEISGNFASAQGAGVYDISDKEIVIKSGKLSGNKTSETTDALKGGALYLESGAKLAIEGGEIFSNTANNGAGVFLNSASMTMTGGVISSNVSGTHGGAAYVNGTSSVKIGGGTISSNKAKTNGGAIFMNNIASSLVMDDGQIVGNSSTNGGAIAHKGVVTINGGTITGNNATKLGGGIYLNNSGSLTVNGGTFANTSKTGGDDLHIIAGLTATLLGGTFTNIENAVGVVELGDDVVVSGNIKATSATSSIKLLNELSNPINIEISGSTPSNFLKFDMNNPYCNAYRAISNINLTDSTKTLYVGESEILVGSAGNKIEVVADKVVVQVQKSAVGGQTVEFKVDPNYVISNLSVVDNLDNAVEVTQNGDTYSFVMPAASGVKIDYGYAKATLPITVDEDIAEFIQIATTGQFMDTIKITLKEVVGKKLENLYVGNGTYSQRIDLYDSEFLMFAGATISGTFIDYSDALETLPGTVIFVENETELLEALKTDGAIIALMQDIVLTNTLEIPVGTYTIVSVNGSALFRGANLKGNMIHVNWRTTLNLGHEDVRNVLYIDGRNQSDTTGSLIFVEDCGVVNMYEGTVLRNNRLLTTSTNYADAGKGNKLAGGAGVYNYNGIFNMYGGKITGNYSTSYGAGVYNFGRFNFYGGSIDGNQTTIYGGGVYNLRIFYQDGGDILNNVAGSDGGGIYNAKSLYSYYYLISGKVSGNSCSRNGAGVFINASGVAWIKGGEISNNTTNGNGGGIGTKGTLYMLDGVIKYNVATKVGGGIYSYCDGDVENFTYIRGGSLVGNSATHGGAIAIKGGLFAEISGVEITGNTASVLGSGIYTYVEGYIVPPKVELRDVYIANNTSPESSQICISDGVLEIGSGVEVVGKISTLKAATKNSAYIIFADNLDFELEINPYKYADYENEQYNVLSVKDGVGALELSEKIKLTNTQYDVKVVKNNLYIYKVA